jgi:hypothetical protein
MAWMDLMDLRGRSGLMAWMDLMDLRGQTGQTGVMDQMVDHLEVSCLEVDHLNSTADLRAELEGWVSGQD